MRLSRRQFLAATAAAALPTNLASAIDPIKRPSDKPDLKLEPRRVQLSAQFLNLKKPTMTLFDFIDLAAELPLDAVELTSYYWAETTDAYAGEAEGRTRRRRSSRSPACRSATTSASKDAAERQEAGPDSSRTGPTGREGRRQRRSASSPAACRRATRSPTPRSASSTAMNECCAVAEKLGVMLALENHGGITDTPEHLLELVKPVKSPALGVNIDTGNFHTAGPLRGHRQDRAVRRGGAGEDGSVTRASKKQEADLGRVVKILKDANFHGYVALEYEAKPDPKVAVPKYVKELRKLIG